MTRRRGVTLILVGIGIAILGVIAILASGLYRDGAGTDPSAGVLAVWMIPLVGFVVSMLGGLILFQGKPEQPAPTEYREPQVFRAPIVPDGSDTARREDS